MQLINNMSLSLLERFNPLKDEESIHTIPDEILGEIFSHLDVRALAKHASLVSKKWHKVTNDHENLWKARFCKEFVFFGENEWIKNFGDPGKLPPISYKSLFREAINFTKKWPSNWDKKMFWLQPKDILRKGAKEREALTPQLIGEMVAPKMNSSNYPGNRFNPTGYSKFSLGEHGNRVIQESCWAGMTPDVIPNSKGKSYTKQKKMVNDFGGDVPELLYAATGIFLKSLSTKENIFSWITCTSCKESINGWQMVVGHMSFEGLDAMPVSRKALYFPHQGRGIAAMIKIKGVLGSKPVLK